MLKFTEHHYGSFSELSEVVSREVALYFNDGNWGKTPTKEVDMSVLISHIKLENDQLDVMVFADHIAITQTLNSTQKRIARCLPKTFSDLVRNVEEKNYGIKTIKGIPVKERMPNPDKAWSIRLRFNRGGIYLAICDQENTSSESPVRIPRTFLKKIEHAMLYGVPMNSNW